MEQDDVDDEDYGKKTIQRSRCLKQLNKMMLMKMIMEEEDNTKEVEAGRSGTKSR